MMDSISEHIAYLEAIKSQTAERLGIKNIPNDLQLTNMKYVAGQLFEPLRKWWNKPIGISSFFRCLELNHAIGGSSTSQHCLGLAIDIDADMYHNGLTNFQIHEYFSRRVKEFNYDQLIYEFGTEEQPAWVHISKKPDGGNRNQNLRAVRKNGKTIYELI
jgi:zinc D-Ala-D-Ala carboxypeptidase